MVPATHEFVVIWPKDSNPNEYQMPHIIALVNRYAAEHSLPADTVLTVDLRGPRKE